MDNLSAIRCTANPASITADDLIEAAVEIAADIDGDVTRDSIAASCDLPSDCDAISSHVVEVVRAAIAKAEGGAVSQ